MRDVAYCRVSTDKEDQQNSLAAQKKFFLQFTDKSGRELVGIYADEGLSGTKIKNRTEFLRLMQDARAGLFDRVIVKDISRFARNTVDFLQSIRELKSLGIETIFITANMTVMENSEFVLTIFGALAQEESANLSKRVKFGKKINAERGRVPTQVYGYDKVKGENFTLYINEEEARWVRQIFEWYNSEGNGALKISHLLNGMGVKTKRGNTWSQVAVNRLLRNELYAGKVVNGKAEVLDFLTGERIDKPPEEWLISDRPDLAIITEEQFQKAQEIVASRNGMFPGAHEHHSNKHILSTIIKCKECGCSFRRFERTYVNTFVRWFCSGRNKHGTGACPNTVKLDEDWLLKVIEEQLFDFVANSNKFIAFTEMSYKKPKSANEDVTRIRDAISAKENRRQKYLDMYADELISREELNSAVGKIKKDIGLLESELNKISGAATTLKPDDVRKLVRQAEIVAANPIKSNAQLKTVIDRVEVGKDGAVDIFIKGLGKL